VLLSSQKENTLKKQCNPGKTAIAHTNSKDQKIVPILTQKSNLKNGNVIQELQIAHTDSKKSLV